MQQACGQVVCADSPATEGGSSRSDSPAQQQASGRTAAQSPRAGQARLPQGGKAKAGSVLGTILSPVLSLLHGGSTAKASKEPREEQAAPSTVLLEVRWSL